MKRNKYFFLGLMLCVGIFLELTALGYLGTIFAWLMQFLSGL